MVEGGAKLGSHVNLPSQKLSQTRYDPHDADSVTHARQNVRSCASASDHLGKTLKNEEMRHFECILTRVDRLFSFNQVVFQFKTALTLFTVQNGTEGWRPCLFPREDN